MGNCCQAEHGNEVVISANTKKPKSFRSYNQGQDEILDAYLDERVVGGLSDYENNDVQEILRRLGPYDYGTLTSDGVIRERRSMAVLDNKTRYEGYWNVKTGERDGMGVLVWPDGSIYEGFWKNNKANGRDRDVYVGEWLNDKAHGYGVYMHSDGAKYEGQWFNIINVNFKIVLCRSNLVYAVSYHIQMHLFTILQWYHDKQQGKGRESWPDGAIFEGNYFEGKKEGHGYFKWADGSDYKGEFKDNNIHGNGHYRWADGRAYEGEWQFNKMHGTGLFTWDDGRKYEGEYHDDKKQGHGIFIWPDGRKYDGGWLDGKQHGYGKYYSSSGEIKFGEWKDGKRNKWITEEEYKAAV